MGTAPPPLQRRGPRWAFFFNVPYGLPRTYRVPLLSFRFFRLFVLASPRRRWEVGFLVVAVERLFINRKFPDGRFFLFLPRHSAPRTRVRGAGLTSFPLLRFGPPFEDYRGTVSACTRLVDILSPPSASMVTRTVQCLSAPGDPLFSTRLRGPGYGWMCLPARRRCSSAFVNREFFML